MPTRATGTLCLHLHWWNKHHYLPFALHFEHRLSVFPPPTHTAVFTFLDSFVADMVNSPGYIIKCMSATRHRHRLAVLMFFQWHHPSHLFIFISPSTFWVNSCCFFTSVFIPLVIALLSGAQLVCICSKEEKKKSNPNPGVLICMSGRTTWIHSQVLPGWRLYHQINSLSLEDVKICRIALTGCWQKQPLDLTKKKKKKEVSQPQNKDKRGGGCSRQGCYWSAQVSLQMFQNADSLTFTWTSPSLAPSS